MKFEYILEIIRNLAKSQGFYGRLYRDIMELKEKDFESFEEFKEKLEKQNFKEPLDVVLYFEC